MSAHTTEAQAAIVRTALKALANSVINPRVMSAAMQLTVADDEALASFARKIR